MVDKPLLREGRNDQRRDAGPGAPAVTFRRRDMVPKPTVFVIGDDHHHVRPLRTLLQMSDDIGYVLIAIQHIGITRMLVQIALRLVEGDLRERSTVDSLDELAAAKPAIP